jgi:hypothetical protein
MRVYSFDLDNGRWYTTIAGYARWSTPDFPATTAAVSVNLQNTNKRDRFLPPAYARYQVESSYYFYADLGPFTDFDVIGWRWLCAPPPPSTIYTFGDNLGCIEFTISRTGTVFSNEGFVLGPAILVHFGAIHPINSGTYCYEINITSITNNTLSFVVTGIAAGSGPRPSVAFYSTSNPLYILQDLGALLQPAFALNPPGATNVFSSLSGIEQYNNHPDAVRIFKQPSSNSFNITINTPSGGYAPPPCTLSVPIYEVRTQGGGHYLSIQDAIDYTQSLSYPAAYPTELSVFFFPDRTDFLTYTDIRVVTCYPNQNTNQDPHPWRLTLTRSSVSNVFNISVPSAIAGNPNFQQYECWLFIKPRETYHNQNIAGNDVNQFLRVYRCTQLSSSAYSVSVNLADFQHIPASDFQIYAGLYYRDTTTGYWYATYSNPVDFELPSGRLDAVTLSTDLINIGREVSFGSVFIDTHRVSMRYKNFSTGKYEFPPHDSLYVCGFYEMYNRGISINDFSNLVGQITAVNVRLYGVTPAGQRQLLLSKSYPLDKAARLRRTVYGATIVYDSNNPANTNLIGCCRNCVDEDVYSLTHFPRRRIVSPRPYSTGVVFVPFANNCAGLTQFLRDIHTALLSSNMNDCWFWNDLDNLYQFCSPLILSSDETLTSVISEHAVNIRIMHYQAIDCDKDCNCACDYKNYGMLVTAALPLPRYINNFFYKNDRAPFEADATNDFAYYEAEMYLQGLNLLGISKRYPANQIFRNSAGQIEVMQYQPLNNVQLLLDDAQQRVYQCPDPSRFSFTYTLYADEIADGNIVDELHGNVYPVALAPTQAEFFNDGGYINATDIQVYFFASLYHNFWQTIPLQSRFSSNVMEIDAGGKLTIDKTKLQPGRYCVYFRGGCGLRVEQEHSSTPADFLKKGREVGFYELDCFVVPPPSPLFDVSSEEDDCKTKMPFLCDEEIRFITEDVSQDFLNSLPSSAQYWIFRDTFDRETHAIIEIPSAQEACPVKTFDWCGIEIVNELQYKTITIRANMRGRIDNTEIYVPVWNDQDYFVTSRFFGSLEKDADAFEEVEYRRAVTLQKESIFRRYTPSYNLTLILHSACWIRHLLLLQKARFWIVEAIDNISFRVACIPKEIKYERLSSTTLYKVSINLSEIRWPGEYRYPLQ